MKSERKAALLAITENIEMKLFSSEESCVVIPAQEKDEKYSFDQRRLEHPLVADCDEEPELQVQTKLRQLAKPKTEPPAKDEAKHCSHVPEYMEEIQIEMEVFPPLRMPESELIEMNSNNSSIMTLPSSNKASRLKWKRQTLQQTGLVVKDVVCLPRGQYLAQLERHIVPQGKERAALVAMGMTARITIDCGWSANQMQSRLALLFRRLFVRRLGQRFSFTYLQCVQGSRALFVPETPAEGWTGEQVLRISGHGALYIISHQNYPECTLDLDIILRLFRQQNVDRDVETHICVRRGELLRSALKVVRRPDFCFKAKPIITFSEEETDGNEGPLREFFRLTLLELQESSIFEGHPGRLFLTCDLTALEDRKYYEAGVLIGWSLAQGGPGPRCLHPTLYQFMCGQNPSLEGFDWNDIVDTEAQMYLQQLHSCTDVKLLSPNLCDWVASCGIPGIYSAHSEEIPAIYMRLVKNYIYHRVTSMISQFINGLNSCGELWDMVQSHWEVFVPVMTNTQQQPLTLEEFKQLFTVCYSRPDSQLRAAEEATVRHWETVLTLVSGGKADFSFEDLLIFITGTDHLPPLGFPKMISLHFYSQDASTSGVRLPYASTCALELFLQRGVARAADLLALLSRAVRESLCFTQFHGEDGCKK
ncbi:hypothetical protein D5F01_LYC06850 [Larimichthys crocea]|uniref:HECT domain-containing protein n=1 Tax=Larimichthys crocea TaxID=215358 RepID=A0A6G0IQW8_LARCR|nr:hypothetical protein D5F01_LYC06850 [Larimichthys crocea]